MNKFDRMNKMNRKFSKFLTERLTPEALDLRNILRRKINRLPDRESRINFRAILNILCLLPTKALRKSFLEDMGIPTTIKKLRR
jgi:hypothetical protein